MSREIKFSCMWHDGTSWMDLKHTLEEMENGEHWDALSDQPLLRKFVLKHKRQYTGLKDKNGVEIYESDVVMINKGVVARVEWIKEFLTFCPFTSQEWEWFKTGNNHFKYCYDAECNYGKCHFLCQFDSYELEVIGNIYENSELMEKTGC